MFFFEEEEDLEPEPEFEEFPEADSSDCELFSEEDSSEFSEEEDFSLGFDCFEVFCEEFSGFLMSGFF